jgi:hypothetical protein
MGMKTMAVLVAAAALLLGAGASLAAPPTPTQKAQFVKECLHISGGNTTLCNCKAEQAMQLADEAFMQVILASMNGKALSHEQNVPYGIYISRSNAVCAPGM